MSGPPIYAALAALPPTFLQRTLYAGSGMAAIAAILAALECLRTPVEIAALPGSYCETLELMESRGRNVKLLPAGKLHPFASPPDSARVLWLDCCVGAGQFKQLLNFSASSFDLILFDTTGLWTGSGRVRRLLHWALKAGVSVVLLRSHTKLDSLGVEYGRLGSVVFVGDRDWRLSGGNDARRLGATSG